MVRVVAVKEQNAVALVRLLQVPRAPFLCPLIDVTEALSRGEIARSESFDTGLAASKEQLTSRADASLKATLELIPAIG